MDGGTCGRQMAKGGSRSNAPQTATNLLRVPNELVAEIDGATTDAQIEKGLRLAYGVSTARLTIFSFCSLPSSAATSFLPIAPLPNWMRNMPSRAPPMIEAW